MKQNKINKEAAVTFLLALVAFGLIFSFNAPDNLSWKEVGHDLLSLSGFQTFDTSIGYINLTVFSNFVVNVTLISPPNNNVYLTHNISLVCNASASGSPISNITLYHDINGVFGPNKTVNITSLHGQAQFNFTNITSGEYHWNCMATNANNDSMFALENRTFYVMDLNLTVIVLVDGIPVNYFPEAGVPYNLTIMANDNESFLPIDNVRVIVEETNSLSFFSLPQITDSLVRNRGIGETTTNPLGRVSLAVIPTGGIPAFDSQLGGYNVTVRAIDVNNNTLAVKVVPVVDRDPTGNASAVSIPNAANVGTSVTTSFQLFSSLNDYLNDPTGSGINHNISINASSGVITGLGSTLYVSQPAAFNVEVFNSSGPIENATINITESIGYYIFVYPQFQDIMDDDVTNAHTGSTKTNSTGIAQMVMVPTGGAVAFDTLLGPYFVRMDIYHPNGMLINSTAFNVDRTITGPSGFTLENIPNIANIGSDNTNLVVLLANINERLNAN